MATFSYVFFTVAGTEGSALQKLLQHCFSTLKAFVWLADIGRTAVSLDFCFYFTLAK